MLAYRSELPSRYSADKGFSRTGAESEFQDKLGCELGKKKHEERGRESKVPVVYVCSTVTVMLVCD